MAGRSEQLATKFEQANNQMISAVDKLSDDEWRSQCQAEQWPVGVTAHHVAMSSGAIAGLVQAVAGGRQLPSITPEIIDQGNAQHAKEYANCTKQETIQLLRQNGESAAKTVRGLGDEQLENSAEFLGNKMDAQAIIENVLIGHVNGHLASMRGAVGAAS